MIYTRIQRLDMPKDRRVIAISDVHGHLQRLKNLLAAVRPGPDDVLIFVGDLMERGMESLGALRFVMELVQSGKARMVLGNVDEWMFEKALTLSAEELYQDAQRFIHWHGASFLQDLADEMDMTLSPDMNLAAFRDGVRRVFAREYDFVQGLPTILQTPSYTFVHGGLPPGPIEDLEGIPARRLTKWDAFMDEGHCMERWTIVGHWPVCLYAGRTMGFSPVVNHAQRIMAIDGGSGVKSEGQLNALILQDGKVAWESRDELPVRVALDAQEESLDPHCVTYMNGAVELVRKEGSFALVRHQPTGNVLWVPEERLFERDGQLRCNDITDYELPVAPGDALSVIWETERGFACKKDGVEGWYRGRLAPCGQRAALPAS